MVGLHLPKRVLVLAAAASLASTCFENVMHRAGWEGRKGNSGMAFAWFVRDRSHTGPTTIDRISWESAS